MEPGTNLDERQLRVLAALRDRRDELADLYRLALMLLDGELAVPGARSRVAFIGHCMREVMNRVLDSFGRSASPPFKPSTRDQIVELPDLLARFPQLDLIGSGDSVPVPRKVAAAMDRLFRAAVQEKGRVRDNVAALITDDGNAAHVAVTRWMESRKFFVRWAHLTERDISESDLPQDAVIREHIRVFEELFDAVVTAFFVSRRAVNELLAEINETDEDPDA